VEHGIKVNAICPGNFFDGPLWSDPDRGLFVQYLRTGKVPGAKTVADVKAFYEAKVKVLQEQIEHHVEEEEKRVEGMFRIAPDAEVKGLQVRVFEGNSDTPKLTHNITIS